MKLFTFSPFSCPGTLHSRHMAVEGLGGYLGARSYVVPDVSGGVNITFEEI